MRIVITGTPGTGKTSLSKTLAEQIHYPRLDVKKLVEQRKIYRIIRGEAEKTVNMRALQRAVTEWFRNHPNGIAESHLLCEFDAGADIVVVMRCQPDVLKKRLEKRRYSKDKIRSNVESEALDYCLVRAEDNYRDGRVMPIDTTRRMSAKTAAGKILNRQGDKVDWSAWLRKNAVRLAKS
ncbi:AAA family ATPase [Candidatus Micrarchaeota archaeon]|nr:AAA family ATPase [Candidatus Micrarchaeota archaeon]